MALLTVQTIARAGVAPTLNAVSASDTFANDGRTYIDVNNGGATSLTVTIVTPATVDGLAIDDRTVTIAAGQRRVIGPFPKATYNHPTTGLVTVNFSATASITCAVLRLPNS